MPIGLIHDSTTNEYIVTIDSNNSTVILDNNSINCYLNFYNSILSSATEQQLTNDLFTYSYDTSNDTHIYNFNNNCIVFDENSSQCNGLFDIQKDNVTI